jgi:CubicO group peptidase (beta-lactamase class C family)
MEQSTLIGHQHVPCHELLWLDINAIRQPATTVKSAPKHSNIFHKSIMTAPAPYLYLTSLKALTLTTLCLILTACGNLSYSVRDIDDAEAKRLAITGNLQAEVNSLAQPVIEQGITPGMIVGVLLPDGSTTFFGYGVTGRDDNRTPDADTIFAVGSLSKGFLGDLTAVLVNEGVLSWNDTLSDLLPPDTPLSADARKITLLQLATHTSGIPLQPYTKETFENLLRYFISGKNFYSHLNSDYVLRQLIDFKAPKVITAS